MDAGLRSSIAGRSDVSIRGHFADAAADGPRIWWGALKIDFFPLTPWQVGMYGWMALVIFVWFGPIPPTHIEFWFMMRLAMACGFCTAYPMNWVLIKAGIKTAM